MRLPSGDEAVLLVDYRDSAAVLADTRLSRHLTAPGSPRMTPGPGFFDDPESLLNKEGEDHQRIRRIVASAFTPRRVERWKPTIAAVAADLIDAMERIGSQADLVADYCFQFPVRIICKLRGVPERDRGHFHDWSNAFVSAARMAPQERIGLIREFTACTAELLAAKRAEPGKDLIDDLIAARDGADRPSESELVYQVAGLIAAGNETTSNMLGRAVLTLLRDELAYPDSEKVRFDREASAQIVFGAGPHHCPGAHLATAELQIGLGRLGRAAARASPRRGSAGPELHRGRGAQLTGVAAGFLVAADSSSGLIYTARRRRRGERAASARRLRIGCGLPEPPRAGPIMRGRPGRRF